MLDMIIRECRHGIVAVIVIWLIANIHTSDTRFLGRFLEVLGQELTLLVEIVAGALENQTKKKKKKLTLDSDVYHLGI
jgi:hypothetical protein